MLVIRMQRTGRKGHAMFRLIVQDSRLTPTSGKVVAYLGSYDPHAKAVTLDKEKAVFYLGHGAQPSTRVASLLKSEDIKLPNWVKLSVNKERQVKNADKRRSTSPLPEKSVEDKAPPVDETPAEASPSDKVPSEEVSEESTADMVDEASSAVEVTIKTDDEEALTEAAASEASSGDANAETQTKAQETDPKEKPKV